MFVDSNISWLSVGLKGAKDAMEKNYIFTKSKNGLWDYRNGEVGRTFDEEVV